MVRFVIDDQVHNQVRDHLYACIVRRDGRNVDSAVVKGLRVPVVKDVGGVGRFVYSEVMAVLRAAAEENL